MATATSRILTSVEAAQRIGRSGETVRRLIAAGKLRARLVGGRWLIDAASVAALERPNEEPRP